MFPIHLNLGFRIFYFYEGFYFLIAIAAACLAGRWRLSQANLDVLGFTDSTPWILLGALLGANPGARLVVDPDSVTAVAGLPADHVVARPGDRLRFGGTTVDVVGGLHAAVYGEVPGCTNSAYVVDAGAFVHPGDSFFVPPFAVDVLAVAVDGPWLKLSEAVDYIHAVMPRVAVPIHEGETTDPAKYAGMLDAFSPDGVVRRLVAAQPAAL